MYNTILTLGSISALILPLWLMIAGKIRMGGFFLLVIGLAVLTIVIAQPFKSSEQLQAERETRISQLRTDRNTSIEKTQDAITHNDLDAAEFHAKDAEKYDTQLKEQERNN